MGGARAPPREAAAGKEHRMGDEESKKEAREVRREIDR